MSSNNSSRSSNKTKRVVHLKPGFDIVLSAFLFLFTPLCIRVFSLLKSFACFIYSFKDKKETSLAFIDPGVDVSSLKIDETSHVLTFASDGRHVFDCVLRGSAVTAVDEDIQNIALLELKVVAVEHLPYEQFFEIFGQSNVKLLRHVYPCSLRPHLTDITRKHLDDHMAAIQSFMYLGRYGHILWVVFRCILPLMDFNVLDRLLESGNGKMLSSKTKHDLNILKFRLDKAAYIVDNVLFRISLLYPGYFGGQALLGINSVNVTRHFFDKTLSLGGDLNYAVAGYMRGRYLKNSAPQYLRKSNFDLLKSNLRSKKLRLEYGSIYSAISNATTPFTTLSLLDYFDNLNDQEINSCLACLVTKLKNGSKCKMMWCSVAHELHATPLALLNPNQVNIHHDSIGILRSVWVATLSPSLISFEERLYDGPVHCVDLSNAFTTSFPLKKKRSMTWVIVGDDLHLVLKSFSIQTLKKYCIAIHLFCLSKSTLEQCKEYTAKMRLHDLVHISVFDISNFLSMSSLDFGENSIDVVAFSNSLSKLQGQAEVVNMFLKYLKRKGDGAVIIADKFLNESFESVLPPLFSSYMRWKGKFNRWWSRAAISTSNLEQCLNPSLHREWHNHIRDHSLNECYQGISFYRQLS